MTASSSRRCTICRDLDRPARMFATRRNVGFRHSNHSKALFERVVMSARLGCAGCQIITEMLHEHIPHSNRLEFSLTMFWSRSTPGLCTEITISYPVSPTFASPWRDDSSGDSMGAWCEQRELFVLPSSAHMLSAGELGLRFTVCQH